MKITRQQLRRIIGEAFSGSLPDQLEPQRFRSKSKAEDAAISMVFGDDPNQRLDGALPWEIRIISLDGEYALFAMSRYGDDYEGEGQEIAAVPRGGSIRYGRRI